MPTESVQLNRTKRKKQIKKDSYKEESLRHSFRAKKRRKGKYTLPLVRILGLTQCPTSLQLNLLRLRQQCWIMPVEHQEHSHLTSVAAKKIYLQKKDKEINARNCNIYQKCKGWLFCVDQKMMKVSRIGCLHLGEINCHYLT